MGPILTPCEWPRVISLIPLLEALDRPEPLDLVIPGWHVLPIRFPQAGRQGFCGEAGRGGGQLETTTARVRRVGLMSFTKRCFGGLSDHA